MDIFLVVVIIFAAFLIRSTFGFGDALFGMPLLAMVIGIRAAAPLMALFALVMALMILWKHRRFASFAMSWKLVLSSLPGIPIGLLYLSQISEGLINAVLGIFIIVFAVVRLREFVPKRKAPAVVTYLTGFISGILGGAYNTNGPPVIMLLSAKGWSQEKFRATLQGYFFFTGIGVVSGHIIWGNVTSGILQYFLYGLPALLLSWWIGERWFARFSPERFYRWVYVLLILIGVGLIVSSVVKI